MTAPAHPPGRDLVTTAGDDPAAALGDVWDALDALPRSTTPPSTTATTIEMVAVSAQHRAVLAARPTPLAWLGAAGLVIAGFIGGATAGRATLPSPDGRLLQHLPLAENLDVLREAGSVEFLREVARRGYPPPRWFPPLQQPPGDDRGFDDALAALQAASAPPGDKLRMQAERRARVESLSEEARGELDDRLREFSQLGNTERRQVTELANALVAPKQADLVAAARLWHAWVYSRDPAERHDIVSLDTTERLEWLDRHARLQSRFQMRQFIERERENRRGALPPEGTPRPPR